MSDSEKKWYRNAEEGGAGIQKKGLETLHVTCMHVCGPDALQSTSSSIDTHGSMLAINLDIYSLNILVDKLKFKLLVLYIILMIWS